MKRPYAVDVKLIKYIFEDTDNLLPNEGILNDHDKGKDNNSGIKNIVGPSGRSTFPDKDKTSS